MKDEKLDERQENNGNHKDNKDGSFCESKVDNVFVTDNVIDSSKKESNKAMVEEIILEVAARTTDNATHSD